MFFKKFIGLLAISLMIGTILAPSSSWSMNEMHDSEYSFEKIPNEIICLIFWKYLQPFDWGRVSGISKALYRIGNSKYLWGHLHGQSLDPYKPEENKEKLEVLTALFQVAPSTRIIFY